MESRAELLCGDCLDVMCGFPDCYIDLTVTSPPYDNLRTYKGYSFNFEAIAAELYRVTAPGGVVVWVVSDATINGSETGTSFRQALFFKDSGFNLHDTMIFRRERAPLNHNRYEQHFEYMFVLSKGTPKTFNGLHEPSKKAGKSRASITMRQQGNDDLNPAHKLDTYKATKLRSNIWAYGVGNGKSTLDKEAFKHPATFPEALARDHILSWSNEGDLVFDPFVGSGTTGKMAILNKRRFIGCDVSPEYIEIAKWRLEKWSG